MKDLAQILKEQPTWAEALRAPILSEDLLDLPSRFDRFIEEQRGVNQELRQFNEEQLGINQGFMNRLNSIEGRLGNLEGGRYERNVRAKAFARAIVSMRFESAYVALNQDGLTDPRLTQSVERAVRSGVTTRERIVDLYEADLIVSANHNRHMVVEVSVTADNSDIDRARARADVLAEITGGEVTPAVFTANLNAPRRELPEAQSVEVFMVPT